MTRIALLVILASLAGCATGGPKPDGVVATYVHPTTGDTKACQEQNPGLLTAICIRAVSHRRALPSRIASLTWRSRATSGRRTRSSTSNEAGCHVQAQIPSETNSPAVRPGRLREWPLPSVQRAE